MELTGAAEAAQKVRDEKSERWWRLVTRRGSGSRTNIILSNLTLILSSNLLILFDLG